MRLVFLLVSIAFFGASFDSFLALRVGGTIRLAQLAMLFAMIAAIAHVVQTRRILWPKGGTALLLWIIIQGALLARSRALSVSVQLYILTLFTMAGIYATVQLFGRSAWLPKLMSIYLKSYVFVAMFASFQFVAPALHLGAPLTNQWIVHGLIPRLNGFNYEPSYFATYIAMGWIMVLDLRVSNARIVAGRLWHIALVMLGAVLILSTSKTGWIFMIVEGLARLWPTVLRLVRRQTRRLGRGSLLVPLPNLRVVLMLVLIVLVTVAGLSALNRIVSLNVFLSGTGINGNAAHSLNDRSQRFTETLAVFKAHPLFGISQGGVAAEIAAGHGIEMRTLDDLRVWWGFPVPLEVIAASGTLGFLPLLWFFLANTAGQAKLMRLHAEDERTKWLRALIRGLIYELLLLLADQNLLRVYLWFHVTMVVVVGYHLRYSPAYETEEAGPLPAERLATA